MASPLLSRSALPAEQHPFSTSNASSTHTDSSLRSLLHHFPEPPTDEYLPLPTAHHASNADDTTSLMASDEGSLGSLLGRFPEPPARDEHDTSPTSSSLYESAYESARATPTLREEGTVSLMYSSGILSSDISVEDLEALDGDQLSPGSILPGAAANVRQESLQGPPSHAPETVCPHIPDAPRSPVPPSLYESAPASPSAGEKRAVFRPWLTGVPTSEISFGEHEADQPSPAAHVSGLPPVYAEMPNWSTQDAPSDISFGSFQGGWAAERIRDADERETASDTSSPDTSEDERSETGEAVPLLRHSLADFMLLETFDGEPHSPVVSVSSASSLAPAPLALPVLPARPLSIDEILRSDIFRTDALLAQEARFRASEAAVAALLDPQRPRPREREPEPEPVAPEEPGSVLGQLLDELDLSDDDDHRIATEDERLLSAMGGPAPHGGVGEAPGRARRGLLPPPSPGFVHLMRNPAARGVCRTPKPLAFDRSVVEFTMDTSGTPHMLLGFFDLVNVDNDEPVAFYLYHSATDEQRADLRDKYGCLPRDIVRQFGKMLRMHPSSGQLGPSQSVLIGVELRLQGIDPAFLEMLGPSSTIEVRSLILDKHPSKPLSKGALRRLFRNKENGRKVASKQRIEFRLPQVEQVEQVEQVDQGSGERDGSRSPTPLQASAPTDDISQLSDSALVERIVQTFDNIISRAHENAEMEAQRRAAAARLALVSENRRDAEEKERKDAALGYRTVGTVGIAAFAAAVVAVLVIGATANGSG